MKIIGFVGPKGSGKDTAADLLKEMGKARGKVSFAGPLKDMCAEVFDIPPNFFHDPDLKEKPFTELENFGTPMKLDRRTLRLLKKQCTARLPEVADPETGAMAYNIDRVSVTGLEDRQLNTPREVLQVVATDFIRNKVYDEWHMRAAFSEKALAKLESNKIYCVTDIRFPNEYEFLREKFGDAFECYYVERPEAEERLAKATHPSETEILKIKALLEETNVLQNDGTIAEFKKKLKALKPPKGETSKSGTTGKPGSRFVYGPRS